MSLATLIVRAASATLPTHIRDRHREEWLADVRDAREAGVGTAQIALGSVAFTLTLGRSFPKRQEFAPTQLDRRARIARAIAVSGAVLALSQWASMFSDDYLGDNLVPDAPTVALTSFLISCSLLAAVLALTLVFLTRGISTPTRSAVVLFALASASPLVQSSLSTAAGTGSWQPAFNAAAIAYLAGGVLVVAGLVLGRAPREVTPPREVAPARVRTAITAGAIILLIAVGTLANAVILWSVRAPLGFAAGRRNAGNPIYVEWLRLKLSFEGLVTSIFVWWAVGAALIVLGFIVVAIWRRLDARQVVALAAGTAAVVVIAGGCLLGFLQLAQSGIVPPAETFIVLWLGRVALVAAILSNARGGRSVATNGVTALTGTMKSASGWMPRRAPGK